MCVCLNRYTKILSIHSDVFVFPVHCYTLLKVFPIFFKINMFIDIDVQDISGYTVGTQYLRNLALSEGEMTQYLCNIKMSSINCNTKKYRVPYFLYVLQDKIVHKYMARPNSFSSLHSRQYIR